jgi:hypothetical protein
MTRPRAPTTHEDEAYDIEAETRDADVSGEGQDRAERDEEEADSDTHFVPPDGEAAPRGPLMSQIPNEILP